MTPTIARERMHALFNPRSVAFIGANDGSAFSAISYDLVRRFGTVERTHLVNPNSPQVHGRPTFSACSQIPGGVDCAYLMVPRDRVPAAIDDAAAAGAGSAVVLTAGYAETGDDGARAQQALVTQCAAAGITLLGPNMLGFANVAAKVAVCALPGVPVEPGRVALVSQSGAGAGSLTRFIETHGIRLSYAVTTGNEAMVCIEDVIDYLLDDVATGAVAVFAEAFRKPAAFLAAARKAAALGKALVVLKVGSSELSARTATAHTGALVGDDAVIGAVMRQEGVIRVDHMEELLHTANLAACTGQWSTTGIGVASLSGGACDVIADRAEGLGLPLPELHPSTQHALTGIVSALGQIQNPLDVTGAGVTDPTLLARAAGALAADPGVGFVAVVGGKPTPGPMPGVAAALRESGTPGAYVAMVSSALDTETDAVLRDSALLYIPCIRDALVAMAKVSWWTQRLTQISGEAQATERDVPTRGPIPGAASELVVRKLLEEAGIPVVPGECVTDVDQCRAAAGRFGGRVAMKIVSPNIAHKSDIGGVRLAVMGDDRVAAAYGEILAAAAKVIPRPDIEGVLVSPMRTDGVELIVGVTRDLDWGLILALGFGGIFVEVFGEVALLRLPATTADIERALCGLRAAPLLQGARGRPVTDLKALAAVVGGIARLAESLGDELQALEVNPLFVRGDVIEALDALAIWRPMSVVSPVPVDVSTDAASQEGA